MKRATNLTVAITCAVVTAAWAAAASDPEGKAAAVVAPGRIVAAATELKPFTHTAYIPATADLTSIRLESVKAVKVFTTRTVTTDRDFCEARFSEPGGSMYCPAVRDGSPAPAFRVTYSFTAPPMSADEYGSTRFTFSVDLRPEELSPAFRQAISERKMNRREAATAFEISTTRGSVPRMAIDAANSVFCQGTYVDGGWGHSQTNCRDKVTYKTITVPSDYVAVTVNPVAGR